MHSGTVSGKSFDMFSLNQGLLARCVEAVKEGDALARKTGQIQSFEIFRNGFRMNLVIGRIMIVPPAVCESKEDFPTALLYGALVREIRPEDLADLIAAKIGDTEFDEYSEADMAEIKEKLFQIPGSKKFASLVVFLPSWTAPREYVMFKYTKDEDALANALRHLVFAAYFDPRLSSAFNHIMQDTDTVNHGTELDVTNITPKLPYSSLAEGATQEYPDLQSADDVEASQDRPTGPGSKKKKKASAPKRKIALDMKWAEELEQDNLARGEVDVISAVTEAAEAAVLGKRKTVDEVAADDNAAKHAAKKDTFEADLKKEERRGYPEGFKPDKKKASQVPCPYCKHSEPTTDDLEDHVARAHKNATLGHKIMPGCQGSGNHSGCPGVVDGVHCDCECHEKAEQEGNIGVTKSGAGPARGREVKDKNGWTGRLRKNYDNNFEQFQQYSQVYGIAKRLGFATDEEAWEANPVIYGSVYPEDLHVVKADDEAGVVAAGDDMASKDAEITALFKKKDELKAQGKDKEKGGEYDAVLRELQTKTKARLSSLKAVKAAACKHAPHNPDSMQTVCEHCGREMNYDAVNDTWKVSKKAGEVNGLGEMKVKMKLNLDELPEKAQEKVVDGAANAAKSMGDAETKTASFKCECSDPGCPQHQGKSVCILPAAGIVYRIDMEDETGTAMCEECATDALDSGVFRLGEELPNENAYEHLSSNKTAAAYRLYTGPTIVKQTADQLRNAGLTVRVEGTEGITFETDIQNEQLVEQKLREILGPQWGVKGIMRLSSVKTADTADNAANEKDGEGAIEVKTDADIKNTASLKLTAAFVRSAAITVSRGEDAQGFHMLINMNGREYVLRGDDAQNFRQEYANIPKPPAQVNALVEKYMNKLQPYNAKPAAPAAPAQAKTVNEPSAPGKPDITSWLKRQPALASYGLPAWVKAGGYIKKVAYVSHCPGHKDSKGNLAEWCVKSHETGKILSSHGTEAEAKSHLQDMHAHSGGKEAGAHKPGCDCGFCKNKGKLPGADKDEKDDKEKTASRGQFPHHMTNVLPNDMNDSIVIATMHKLEVSRQHNVAGITAAKKTANEFVSCGWQTTDPAQRAQFPDAEEYHKDHKPGNMGDCDSWECVCGNTPISDGFYPCDEQGNEIEPTHESGWTDKYVCGSCGRIIRQDDGAIFGTAGPEAVRMASLEPKRTNASAEEAASNRSKQARADNEAKLSKLRRNVVADESDDVFAEVTKPFGKPPEVKVKDGDGRPDGATPKLADATGMDWFVTDRDAEGQPKENEPEQLEIPESEPVTGVYTKNQEGKDPVGKALQSVTTDVKAPGDLGESKATDVKEPLDLNEAAARWLGDESVEEHHEEPAESHDEETHSTHINATNADMKCPQCGAQAHKDRLEDPFICSQCGWRSQKAASFRRKYASDRIIATLDDLLQAEPFDPDNEERPDSSLMEGLVSGPLSGGRHETNDTSGPANKVADFDTSGPTTDSEVAPKKETPKLDDITLGGPQNSSERPNVDAVREQVATTQEMDKHETIAEKEKEVAAEAAKEQAELEAPAESSPEEEGATEVVNAPAGSGKIVININAKWLKAHGLFDTDDAEPITSGQGGGGQGSTAGPIGREGMPNLEASVGASDLAAIASKKTAGPLAQEQQGFFEDAVKNVGEAAKNINIIPDIPVGGGAGAGEGAGALGELAEVAPLVANDEDAPNDPPGYAKRVRELEAEGMTTSDAQAAADVEFSKKAARSLQRPTTPSKNYNGWHNWETWHTALLIDNEQPLYETKRNLARHAVRAAKGGPVDIDKLADQMSKVLHKAWADTKAFAESNAREMPDTAWATEPLEAVNWHEIAENAAQDEADNAQYDAANAAKQAPPAPTASKDAATEKEAGFNFFFPGQVLREFYPEVQHEIVDYPNADNKPMIQDVDLAPGKMGAVEKEACEGFGFHVEEEVEAVKESVKPLEDKKQELKEEIGTKEAGSPNYVSTDPAAIGIGRDGKPQVLEGAPLRKENDIRGPMFSEEFYANYPGIPGSALRMASMPIGEFKKKAAASADQKEMLSDFLKKVMGEIACTFVAAFKVTSRPVDLDKIPGTGEVNLVAVENSVNNWPFYAGEVGGRVKFLLEQMNDSDIQDAINDAWSQAAVWHNGSGSGNFTYEVFVRAEAIDTDNMTLKYKFVTGTKGE